MCRLVGWVRGNVLDTMDSASSGLAFHRNEQAKRICKIFEIMGARRIILMSSKGASRKHMIKRNEQLAIYGLLLDLHCSRQTV